jgi:hypothetical protein
MCAGRPLGRRDGIGGSEASSSGPPRVDDDDLDTYDLDTYDHGATDDDGAHDEHFDHDDDGASDAASALRNRARGRLGPADTSRA